MKSLTLVAITLGVCLSQGIHAKDISTDDIKRVSSINMNVPNNHYLVDTQWRASHYNDEIIPEKYTISMEFQANLLSKDELLLSGKAACNSYNTDISVDVNAHRFSKPNNLLVTEMACADPNQRALESHFINAVTNNAVLIKEGRNTLNVGNTAHTFRFVRVRP
jgi:heat shock protein HslJ